MTYYFKEYDTCNRVVNGALQRQKPSFNETLKRVDMWVISSHQFETLLKKHLNIDIDFVADNELGNHYTPVWNAKAKEYVEDQEGYTYQLMGNLIHLGVLEPGNYLIDHTW